MYLCVYLSTSAPAPAPAPAPLLLCAPASAPAPTPAPTPAPALAPAPLYTPAYEPPCIVIRIFTGTMIHAAGICRRGVWPCYVSFFQIGLRTKLATKSICDG